METPFESWIGQPAIVRIALKHNTLSVRGTLLKEQAETLLMKAENGPDLEISKDTVLAIEEVSVHPIERRHPYLQESHEMEFAVRLGGTLRDGATTYVRVPQSDCYRER